MAALCAAAGTGNAEAASKLKILDATAVEGATLAFTVKLKPASEKKVKVAFATADGTAGAADYVASSGKAKLKPGEKKATINVAGLADTTDEPDETFTVTLSSPRGARIADGEATGTISDDDAPAPDPGTPTPEPPPTAPPVLSVGSASVAEGNPPDPATTGPWVWLSAPSAETVSATFTAVPGDDIATTTGTVALPPGTTSASLDLGVTRDFIAETDASITVTLSSPVNAAVSSTPGTLTLLDDDAAPGELVITELLPNPAGVGQEEKEFVEFVNLGSGPVNLNGYDLGTFPTADCRLSGDVAAGGYFVVSDDPLIRDAACPALTLLNSGADSIGLFESSSLVDTVAFNGSTDGFSLSLDPHHTNTTDNDTTATNFCNGTGLYDGNNAGTPGTANPDCP